MSAEVEDRYFDRELSWLDFNARVLQLAEDPAQPLLERAKFLAIFATNLDEFFQIRVAGLKDQQAAEQETGSAAGEIPRRLATLARRARRLVARHGSAFAEVASLLDGSGITLATLDELNDDDQEFLTKVFDAEVLPVLTPLAVDAAHPFPYISNLSLNLGVMVRDPASAETRFARVKIPSNLARLVALPDGRRFVLLEDVVAGHLDALFPGMHIESRHAFRVTRNADLDIQDDEADDLLERVELELRQRRFGRAVRLEVASAMPNDMVELLTDELELSPPDVYRVAVPLDLSALWQLCRLERPDLQDEPWPAVSPAVLSEAQQAGWSIFRVLRHHDLLVHHPYESFADSVQALVEAAADDPDVRAIKMTLYRTGSDSPIIEALIRAAERGKQVVALVELKARFDEENNIARARALEQAGAHVVYGLVGLKTHAKAVMVVRADHNGLRRYCHLGTGNYNPTTARLYEDVGLLTTDEQVGADVAELFNTLTGFSRPAEFARLLVAPRTLRDGIVARIADQARPGGRIVAKMNSLVDPVVIEALYAASAAGADIDLIVRGICCLRPGVDGLSERIRVRSIVGRYLEHSRIFAFGSPGDGSRSEVLIGSADLMPRNLDRRVELLTPVRDEACERRLHDILAADLSDDTNTWTLGPDGTWTRLAATNNVSAQHRLYLDALRRATTTPSVGPLALLTGRGGAPEHARPSRPARGRSAPPPRLPNRRPPRDDGAVGPLAGGQGTLANPLVNPLVRRFRRMLGSLASRLSDPGDGDDAYRR